MTIGKKLQNKRKELNLTQGDVAKKLYVSRQAISNWELDKNYPDLETIVAISNLYQISLDILLKEDLDVVKGVKKTMKRNFVIRTINILTILVISTCLLVNAILNRSLTWSLIVTLSLMTVQVLAVFLSKMKIWNPFLLMCGTSSVIIAFLGLLEPTLQNSNYIQGSFFMSLALPLSIIWLLLIWVVVFIQMKMKWEPCYSISIFFLFGILGGVVTNILVGSEPLWFSALTSTIPCLFLSIIFYLLGNHLSKSRRN